MKSVIDRAASDEVFIRRLNEEPLNVARAEGYDVSLEQMFDFLRFEEALGEGIQDLLEIRLSELAGGKWI